MVTSAVQLLAYRQAVLGREAMARVQARWAARAGIEQTIAVMDFHATHPVPTDAWAMTKDMEDVSQGTMYQATWDIQHYTDGRDWLGPTDEHAKVNINNTANGRAFLLQLDHMTYDMADAILDWIDKDDDVRWQGGEGLLPGHARFISAARRHPPHRGARADGRHLARVRSRRGLEHRWRLNPDEDDGDVSQPPDNADGLLQAGWSEYLTTFPIANGPTASGLPHLAEADRRKGAH